MGEDIQILLAEYQVVSSEIQREAERIFQLWIGLGFLISGSILLSEYEWAIFVAPVALYVWAWLLLFFLWQVRRRINYAIFLEKRINRLAQYNPLLFRQFMYDLDRFDLQKSVNAVFSVPYPPKRAYRAWYSILALVYIIVLFFFSVRLLWFWPATLFTKTIIGLLMAILLVGCIYGYIYVLKYTNEEGEALDMYLEKMQQNDSMT